MRSRSHGRWELEEEEEEEEEREWGGCSDCHSPRLVGERGMDCSHEAEEKKDTTDILDNTLHDKE